MKNFYKLLVFSFFFLGLSQRGSATHIVGGVLSYTYTGVGNTYSITLKLYRDCPATGQFDPNATISVLQANGSLFSPNIVATFSLVTPTPTVPAVLPPCATSPSNTPCVEEGVYTGTVNIPPTPGGVHLYYSTFNRNAAAVNIVNPTTMGETFYAFIPMYHSIWSEDFTLTNGTTSDNGSTAWSGAAPTATVPTSAQVTNGEYKITGFNNASWLLTTQTINISTYTNGVNLSVNLEKEGTQNLNTNDSIQVYYSLNGGSKILFPVNGAPVGNWTGQLFAKATGLTGNTIQVFVRTKFSPNNNSNNKIFSIDMIRVYDNTFIPNSNPAFSALPPILFCSTNTFSFSQAAMDADGDSLVYSMYTPYTHLPAPTFPNNVALIPTVTFGGGYSATSPFNSGGPAVTLNSSTGMMTGVQNANGGRVFGVKVQEYRNGILLSETFRDFEVTAVTCPPFVPSAPGTSANGGSAGIPQAMCAGQTLSLSATFTSGATYNWTGPNGFTSNLQNPTIANTTTLASGTYSVFVTVTGCTGPAGTVAVTVNPIPTAPILASNSPVCTGKTLNLTAAATTGATYNWSGPDSFVSTAQNPQINSVTLNAAGTYTATQTVLGCTSPAATIPVTINQTPNAPVATANTPLCEGQTLNLSSTFSTGATYTWTGPGTFSATAQNPSISNIQLTGSGNYSVLMSVNACTSTIGTVSVTVNPSPSAPAITVNNPLCEGQTLSLAASFTTGASYSWIGPNAFSSASQNTTVPSISAAGAGTYSVNATAAGCPGPFSTVIVTVNPIPVAPVASANTPLCTGLTLSLAATFSTGATYSWTGPNGFNSTLQNPTIGSAVPAATGLYSVSATIAGCTGPVGTVSVNVSTPPSPPTLGANSPLCVGQNLNLTATFTTGLSYTWAGPNSFASNSQNPVISAVTQAAAGTYTALATTAGGCAGPTNTIAVTVNTVPVAPTITSNDPICAGSTLNFTASNAGTTYTWTGPNGFNSNLQNPSISGASTLASGVYSVVTTAAGCTGPAGTLSVTVNPIPTAPTASNNSTICAGQSLNLTAASSGATSYNWTGPNGFNSTVQNPNIPTASTLATGTYSVTRVVNGCTSPAGITIATVNPIPAVPTLGSNGPICSGQTLSLTGLPGGLTYSWSGPNSFVSTAQNPAIAGTSILASGNYSLIVNSLGCNSPAGTLAVTVNQTPATPVAAGTPTLCVGSTINLTSTDPGSATWSWTGPNGFTSSLQNPLITNASAAATGMYSVTVTVGACTSPAGTFSVNVFANPSPPALSANSPICTGQTLSLTAAPIAGASYAWTGPNGFTSSAQNPTMPNVSLVAAGNYSVFVNVSGCGSTGTSVAVSVNTTPNTTATSNGPICAGSNLNLFSSLSSATYTWTGPNGFTSNSQNPIITTAGTVATGVYSITATVAGCNSAAGTISVTVNPIPTAPTASNNSTICAGQSLNLTAASSGATSYNWTGPNGFSSALQNPNIPTASTLASGTYSVTRVVNGCTSPAGITSATVNPIPAVPTLGSNGPLCSGQTLSLTGLPGGLTYSWNGPNSFVSTIQNPTIASTSTLASGNYSLTVNSLGCNSPAGTLAVTVNQTPATPVAGGTPTLCVGSTINLTSTNPGSATWSWTGPNGFTSSLQNPSITNASAAATGMYSVTVTVGACTSPAGTFSVNVFANPLPPQLSSNFPACTGKTLSLTATPIAGASYSWTGPNGFTSAIQNPTIANLALNMAGTYSVFVNVGGCGSTGTSIAVSVFTTPAAPTATNSSPICDGQNLILGANAPGGSYTWAGPNNFISAVQQPTITNTGTVSSGVYSVIVSVNGCPSLPATTTATINPVPAAPTPSSNSAICAGQTLSLSVNSGANAYNWSGPNNFTSTSQNPVITSAPITSSGTYTVTQTALGCTSPSATIIVTVNPVPTSPLIASNAPLCALQILTLTTGTNTSAIYAWSGPNSFISASQNPTLIASLPASGTYSVTQTVLGCTSPAATLAVTVNPAAPTPTVSSNSPICINGTLNFTQPPITNATYSWSGPNGFTSTVQNPSVINSPTIATGVYSVFATVAGCPGVTSTISVLVSQPATVTAASSQTVCANNSTVSLNGASTTGSGLWSSSGNGIFAPNTATGNYVAGSADISAGTVTLTLTSANNGGCSSATTSVLVYITPAPTASAGASQTVCANNATVSLSGSVTIASGGSWSSTGTGTFVPNSSALTASYIPSPADISSGSFSLVLTTTGNGNCFPVSHAKAVTISPAPVVGPTAPQFVCKNNPNFQLNGSSTTGGMIWASSGTGTFSPNANILNPTYIPSTGDTTAGAVTMTITSTNNGGCNPVSQTLTLIYTGTLVVNAGTSQTVCSNNPVQLIGVSTTSAGVWSSSGTGVFAPANSLTTTYAPSSSDILAGAVTLTLTSANNGGCNPVTSTVAIIITPGPSASAGSNQTVCANNASVALNGSFTIATGAIWSSSGTGTFSPNTNSMNVIYTANPADTTSGSTTIMLTTTGNGSCSATTSTMAIIYSPAPLVNAGADISVCKNNFVTQLNGYVSTGAGSWSTTGTGTMGTSTVSPSYTPSTADTTAGSVMFILTSGNNGNCNAVTDTVFIKYSAPPVVTAGSALTVCANNSSAVFTGTSSTGSGTWTSSGDGVFSTNSLSATYAPGSGDILAGTLTLTFSSTNNGGCLPASNQTTLYITPAPTVFAGADQTLCANTGTINLNGSFSISSGITWSTTGTGTFSPNNTSTLTSYLPSSSDTLNNNVKIYLATTGNGNCVSVSDTMQVHFITAPHIFAGENVMLCPSSNNPVLSGVSSVGTATWSSNGTGVFLPNNSVLSPTFAPSTADKLTGTVSIFMQANAGSCGSISDTLLITFRPEPVSVFSYSNNCAGSITQFNNISTTSNGSITSTLWYFNKDTSTVKDARYTFPAAGIQTIGLVVSNGACSDSIMRTIRVQPVPKPNFQYKILCHDSVRFIETSTISAGRIVGWEWNFGDNTTSAFKNPIHVYPDSGLYVVELRVRSDSSCIAIMKDTIVTNNCGDDIIATTLEPAVPSGFTPNSDGSNDVLFVKGGPFNSIEFRVFNEWGNLIFYTNQQSNGWDGNYKDAQQPVGRFIWTLTGELKDGKKISKAGEVILNR